MPPEPNYNNQEIDQALKEFEAKSDGGKTASGNNIQAVITPQNPKTPSHEVEGVSFDTDKEATGYTAIKFYKETAEPKMVKAVVKLSGGKIKNQQQAEWILLVFVVVAVAVSIYLILSLKLRPQKMPPGMVEILKQMSSHK